MLAEDDRVYRALGHRDRRAILRVLGDGTRSVSDVSTEVGLDQPTTSQQLRVLRDAGLVTVEVEGNRRLYSADFARLAEIRSFFDEFWNSSLHALKQRAEAPSTHGSTRPPTRPTTREGTA